MEFTGLTMPPPSQSSWLDRMVEWSFEDSVTMPDNWKYLAELGRVSPEGCACSESVSNLWCCLLWLAFKGPEITG